MTPQELHAAVVKQLEAAAFEAMQAEQPQHRATKNERIAFKLGFYAGIKADVARAPADAWQRAADQLKKDG